jgi:lysophospholipase L1-like esterase
VGKAPASIKACFQTFKRLARGKVRRAGISAAVVGVLLSVVAAAPPDSATGATLARDSGSSAPCFKASFPDCSSTDPDVKFGTVSNGDTTECEFREDVDWGDGTTDVYTFDGGSDGTLLDNFTHRYTKPDTYTIETTTETTEGSCDGSSSTLGFTLLSDKSTLAALGDSYSAGEGTGEYYLDSGACHRSPDAWPVLLSVYDSQIDFPHSNFLACSGATSPVLQGQIEVLGGLDPAPTLVTLTIGGNDVHFSAVLGECYHKNCIRDGALTVAADNIRDERSTLVADYTAVAHADPSATILVVGYPRIFESDNYCGVRWLGLGFKPAELEALNELGAELNDVIAAAAAQAGDRYVDVTNALDRHEMCSTHPWVVQVDLKGLWDQQEGHPTIPGQRAIEGVVDSYIERNLTLGT